MTSCWHHLWECCITNINDREYFYSGINIVPFTLWIWTHERVFIQSANNKAVYHSNVSAYLRTHRYRCLCIVNASNATKLFIHVEMGRMNTKNTINTWRCICRIDTSLFKLPSNSKRNQLILLIATSQMKVWHTSCAFSFIVNECWCCTFEFTPRQP